MPRIAVCLDLSHDIAGMERFLDALAAQTLSDWHLYAPADAPHADATVSGRLASFAARHPGQVTLVRGHSARGTATCGLMARTREAYIVSASPSEPWPRDRLADDLAAMRRAEARHGVSTPVMVGVGGPGRGHVFRPGIRGMLALTGSSSGGMMINRPLLDVAHPVPPEACSDAAWFALVAAGFGVLVPRPGALADAAPGPAAERLRLTCARDQAQATAFFIRYRGSLPRSDERRLALFTSLPRRSPAGRALALWRSRCAPAGLGAALAYAQASGGPPARSRAGVGPAPIARPADLR